MRHYHALRKEIFTQGDIDSGHLQYVSTPFSPIKISAKGNDYAVAISGSNVIWGTNFSYSSFSDLTEVVFYNGLTGESVQLTNNRYADIPVGISGSNALWYGYDGTDYEVFLYNNTTGQTAQLTNNSLNDFAQGVAGSNVIWNTFIDDSTVKGFFYDGVSRQTTQLTNIAVANVGFDYNVAIGVSESNVVWGGFDGNDFEIFLYNIETNRNIQITNNDTNDIAVSISGSNIAWNGFDGTDYEVFFYNGTMDIAFPNLLRYRNSSE